VDGGGRARAGTGADVDGRAGDGAGGRHPAEERGGQVGEALPEQLAVGVVAAGVGHAVGDLGRQQALDGREGGDGERGAEQVAHLDSETLGSDGSGSESGRAPMRATSAPVTCATTVAATTASSDDGSDRWALGAPP